MAGVDMAGVGGRGSPGHTQLSGWLQLEYPKVSWRGLWSKEL